jgi:hypothetical protein
MVIRLMDPREAQATFGSRSYRRHLERFWGLFGNPEVLASLEPDIRASIVDDDLLEEAYAFLKTMLAAPLDLNQFVHCSTHLVYFVRWALDQPFDVVPAEMREYLLSRDDLFVLISLRKAWADEQIGRAEQTLDGWPT